MSLVPFNLSTPYPSSAILDGVETDAGVIKHEACYINPAHVRTIQSWPGNQSVLSFIGSDVTMILPFSPVVVYAHLFGNNP